MGKYFSLCVSLGVLLLGLGESHSPGALHHGQREMRERAAAAATFPDDADVVVYLAGICGDWRLRMWMIILNEEEQE